MLVNVFLYKFKCSVNYRAQSRPEKLKGFGEFYPKWVLTQSQF